MTDREVADTLEAFVERRDSQWDWENHMSTTSFSDLYLDELQQRMINLIDEFPARRGMAFFNPEGVLVIWDYVRELRSRDSKGDPTIPK